MDDAADAIAWFVLGACFGAVLSIATILAIWNAASVRIGRRIATSVRSAEPSAPRQPPATERPTAAIKIGVLPFTDRPTLVHDPVLPGAAAPRSHVVQTVVRDAPTSPGLYDGVDDLDPRAEP